MHGNGWKIALLAWLGLPTLAVAPGFDCGKAATVTEKRICADPALSQLDGKMAAAFERARKRAAPDRADGLQRDQLNWLAQRNGYLPEDGLGSHDIDALKPFYEERIAFLDHVFGGEPASPLLAMIQARAMAAPVVSATADVDAGAPWAALGGDGPVFRQAKERNGTAAGMAARLSADFDAGPALTGILSDVADGDRDYLGHLVKLDAHRLGGIYRMAEGTAHCATWTLFRWQGRAIEPLATPMTLDQNCGIGIGALVAFQNRAYALRVGTSISADDIQAQPYAETGWGKAERLLLRYDHTLPPPRSYCALEDCATLIAQAREAVQRYDHDRDGAALARGLSADESERFETMRRQAAKQTGNDNSLSVLPDFGGKAQILSNETYNQFFDDAVYFPLRWHGELLLARIGPAASGWRTNEDWLLAAWRWDGKTFTPALGMYAPVRRGEFLGAGAVPPNSPDH